MPLPLYQVRPPDSYYRATTYAATLAVSNWKQACKEQRAAYEAWQAAPADNTGVWVLALEAYSKASLHMSVMETIMRNT